MIGCLINDRSFTRYLNLYLICNSWKPTLFVSVFLPWGWDKISNASDWSKNDEYLRVFYLRGQAIAEPGDQVLWTGAWTDAYLGYEGGGAHLHSGQVKFTESPSWSGIFRKWKKAVWPMQNLVCCLYLGLVAFAIAQDDKCEPAIFKTACKAGQFFVFLFVFFLVSH